MKFKNRKRVWKTFMLMILCAGVFLTSGCGYRRMETIPEKESKSLIVITKAMNSLHWLTVEEGAREAGDVFQVNVTVLWPETEDSIRTQQSILQDAILQQPDAIIVAPCSPEGMGGFAEQMKRQGIRLLYVDEEAVEGAEAPYIGSDNYHAGELAAQVLADSLPEGSKVAVIGGSQKLNAHRLRVQGFCDYISSLEDQKITITAVKEVPGADVAGAQAAMRKLLADEPEIGGVFCASALLTMGALEESENNGRHDVSFVGMDTQSDTLSALSEGKILAMISQDGYEIGYRAVEEAVHFIEGEEIPEKTIVESEIITKETAANYLSNYREAVQP